MYKTQFYSNSLPMENDSLCLCGLVEEQSATHILQGRYLLHRFPGTAQDGSNNTCRTVLVGN